MAVNRAVLRLLDSSADGVVRVPAPVKSSNRRGDADYKVRATALLLALLSPGPGTASPENAPHPTGRNHPSGDRR